MHGTAEAIQFEFIFIYFFYLNVIEIKRFYRDNHFLKKSYLTTNIALIVNLEPPFGFMVEIKSIPNYFLRRTVSAFHFNMGHLLE